MARYLGYKGELEIRTDERISPTGLRFKLAYIPGSLFEKELYENRRRKCNKGFLVTVYEDQNGQIGYRCPAEDIKSYLKKGGKIEDTIGRGCLCNGLLVTGCAGDEYELAYVTLGNDLSFLKKLMTFSCDKFFARDVIYYILGIKRNFLSKFFNFLLDVLKT